VHNYPESGVLESSVKPSLFAQAWFDGRFKNHLFPTRVVSTHFHQNDELKTTMAISKRLVETVIMCMRVNDVVRIIFFAMNVVSKCTMLYMFSNGSLMHVKLGSKFILPILGAFIPYSRTTDF